MKPPTVAPAVRQTSDAVLADAAHSNQPGQRFQNAGDLDPRGVGAELPKRVEQCARGLGTVKDALAWCKWTSMVRAPPLLELAVPEPASPREPLPHIGNQRLSGARTNRICHVVQHCAQEGHAKVTHY